MGSATHEVMWQTPYSDVILLTSTFNMQPMIRSLSTSNKVPRADLFVQSTTAASLCTVGGRNEYVQTISGLCQNLSPDTLCLSLWMHYILLLQIIKFECEAPIKQSSHKYTHCTQIFMHTHTHAHTRAFILDRLNCTIMVIAVYIHLLFL